jgi:tetratricopeptide (TPR) repeat protein
LSEEGQFEEAIEIYRRHIQERQSVTDRPDWENPHFYLLQIADLQLQMSQPDKALQTCAEAEQAGVDPALVADRYRTIANWYEERRDMQAAFDILKRYRDRDPLLFEAMLDRVGRALTAAGR